MAAALWERQPTDAAPTASAAAPHRTAQRAAPQALRPAPRTTALPPGVQSRPPATLLASSRRRNKRPRARRRAPQVKPVLLAFGSLLCLLASYFIVVPLREDAAIALGERRGGRPLGAC